MFENILLRFRCCNLLGSEKYIIEFGDKIKETGKKYIFTFMSFGTNNVQNF